MLTFIVLFVFYWISVYAADADYDKQDQWSGSCQSGMRQSPISIDLDSIQVFPSNQKITVQQDGAQFETNASGAALTNPFISQTKIRFFKDLQTQNWESLQFHWHTPSQHLFNGKYYDLQVHIVHSKTKDIGNKLSVIGILFQSDCFIQEDIFDRNNFFENSSNKISFPMKLKNMLYYTYEGSLTTPGCDQIVKWFVQKNILSIRPDNLNKFKQKLNHGKPNSRSRQNLNNRKISLIRY